MPLWVGKMKLTIIYSNEALTDFETILSYYLSSYAYTIAENIESGILEHIELLSTNPTIGHQDLLLKRNDYFVFVSVNYKLVYQVVGTNLIIIRIFDSRQNPSKLNP